MQVVVGKVHDRAAVGSQQARRFDIPLERHFPVEDRGAGGSFDELQRNTLGKYAQRLAQSLAGDAAADRIKARSQRH